MILDRDPVPAFVAGGEGIPFGQRGFLESARGQFRSRESAREDDDLPVPGGRQQHLELRVIQDYSVDVTVRNRFGPHFIGVEDRLNGALRVGAERAARKRQHERHYKATEDGKVHGASHLIKKPFECRAGVDHFLGKVSGNDCIRMRRVRLVCPIMEKRLTGNGETMVDVTASHLRVKSARHFRHSQRWRSRLASVLFLSLFVSFLGHAQQSPAPNPGTPPPVNEKAIFQRAMEMYEAKHYEPALRAFRESADAGNLEAMMHLGLMYSAGEGTLASYVEALKWFRKAAVGGDAQGMCNVGILYYRGLGVEQDYKQAMRWFRDGAAAGNTQAMFNLGTFYGQGLGVPVNFTAAMEWLLRAANSGNSLAMNSIGGMYQKGQGVNIDYQEAMRWYRKAAEDGNSLAIYNIGVLYERGQGVPMDLAEARRWYAKAAASGRLTGQLDDQ
jgi:TPR repeat protein